MIDFFQAIANEINTKVLSNICPLELSKDLITA